MLRINCDIVLTMKYMVLSIVVVTLLIIFFTTSYNGDWITPIFIK
jgi:hypothetical protein